MLNVSRSQVDSTGNQFSPEQRRQRGGSHAPLLLGDGPELDSVSKRADTERPSPVPWEILPPEETRVAPSVMVHPKAKSILTAFIGGATKTEIARVFGLKEKLVRSVIAAAQQLGNHQ